MIREQVVEMVGTDHRLASADVRSVLTLPASAREEVLALARAKLGASGIVLLATCNRTELWASFDGTGALQRSVGELGVPQPDDPLLRAICDMHAVDANEYARYFRRRSGDEAVDHLFNVACGLRSAVVAEDQIASQVKQAIAYSREIGVADSVLEVLFRQAVTSAKRVKSGVRFTRAYATAIDQAIDRLESDGMVFEGATCMVVGNGEYGRLAASKLVERGCDVVVTVRQYTHGTVVVPRGCRPVPYADRYEHLAGCQLVMSATTSPHYTILREPLMEALGGARAIALVDLAIPHDIDPAIADVPGCTLLDIDGFATQIGEENASAIEAAKRLLAEGESEFWDWMDRREMRAHSKLPSSAMFPLYVDLSEKRVVFVGGGAIALRRVRTLLPFAGDIVVHAPDISPELERFADDGAVTLVRDAYDPSMLDGADIVFACTNSAQVNEEVWAECRERGVPVNVCSDRTKCDFYFPGVVQSAGMVVGVSAGGKDHRRVRQLSARIRRLLEEEDL